MKKITNRWFIFLKTHPKFKKIWYYLTCWRPVTKHEHVWLMQQMTKIGYATINDMKKHQEKINGILKYLEKRDGWKDENDFRGMYE